MPSRNQYLHISDLRGKHGIIPEVKDRKGLRIPTLLQNPFLYILELSEGKHGIIAKVIDRKLVRDHKGKRSQR